MTGQTLQTLVPWVRLLGSLALEVTVIAILAMFLQRLAGGGVWRRTLWQAALLGLGLIVLIDLTGVSRPVIGCMSHFKSNPKYAIVQNVHTDWPESLSPWQAPEAEAWVGALPDRNNKRQESARLDQRSGPARELHSDKPKELRLTLWPGVVWLVGIFFIWSKAVFSRVVLFAFGWRRLLPAERTLSERARFLADLMGIRRRVPVFEIQELSGPVAFGILQPAIGLPERFSIQFTNEQKDAMFVHELAHVAARDPFWHFVADFVTGLLWWHPLAWWAVRQFQNASESAADEASLLLNNGPEALAECLVALGKRLAGRESFGRLGIGGNGFRSHLGRRVAKLLEMDAESWAPMNRRRVRLAKLAGPLLLAVMAMAAAGWAWPHQEAEPKSVAQAWGESVAGLALDALRTPNSALQIPPQQVPDLLKDAKLFLDAGKLDQAEALLDEILWIAPNNQPALTYWDFIQEKRRAGVESPPRRAFTNTPLPGFQHILPGKRVTTDQAIDGIKAGLAMPIPRAASNQIDANIGQQILRSTESSRLRTRWFKMDPGSVREGLQQIHEIDLAVQDCVDVTAGNEDPPVVDMLAFLEKTGIDFSPPKSIFYNERLGMLMVRATMQELSIVEKAVQMLNQAGNRVYPSAGAPVSNTIANVNRPTI